MSLVFEGNAEASKPVGEGRFAGAANSAVSPSLLERVLLQRNDALPSPQSHGLEVLDRLAESGEALDELVARRSEWLINDVDEDLYLALGLDQAITAGKLWAIIARAYVRAWRYADKARANRMARGRLASAAEPLREALALMTFGRTFNQGGGWTGPHDFTCVNWEREKLGEIVDDLHLARCERQSKKNERRESIAEGYEALVRLHQELQFFSTSPGRPFHEELFFFAACLGEAFTILTGLKPVFDHSFRKRSGSLDWRGFLDAAFILCGLASQLPPKAIKDGGHGCVEGMPADLLTDKLRRGPPRKEGARHDLWTSYFERLADEFAEPRRPWRQRPHAHAQLNSVGLELDYETEVLDP